MVFLLLLLMTNVMGVREDIGGGVLITNTKTTKVTGLGVQFFNSLTSALPSLRRVVSMVLLSSEERRVMA